MRASIAWANTTSWSSHVALTITVLEFRARRSKGGGAPGAAHALVGPCGVCSNIACPVLSFGAAHHLVAAGVVPARRHHCRDSIFAHARHVSVMCKMFYRHWASLRHARHALWHHQKPCPGRCNQANALKCSTNHINIHQVCCCAPSHPNTLCMAGDCMPDLLGHVAPAYTRWQVLLQVWHAY